MGRRVGEIAKWMRHTPPWGCSGTTIVFDAAGGSRTTSGAVVPETETVWTTPAKRIGSECTGTRKTPRAQSRRTQVTLASVHVSPFQPVIDVDVRIGPST